MSVLVKKLCGKWNHSDLWIVVVTRSPCFEAARRAVNGEVSGEVNGEDLSRYSNNIELFRLRKCPYDHQLAEKATSQTFLRACPT